MASTIVIALSRRQLKNNNLLQRISTPNTPKRSFAYRPRKPKYTIDDKNANDWSSNIRSRQLRALQLVDRTDPHNVPTLPSSSSSSEDESLKTKTPQEIEKEEREALFEALRAEALVQELEHAEDNPTPWFSLLSYPSRALWRVSTKPPSSHVTSTRLDVIKRSSRTNRQLRRSQDKIVISHRLLGEKREKERRRKANGYASTNKLTDEDLNGTTPTTTHKKKIPTDSLAHKEMKGAERDVKPVYYKPEYTLCSIKYRLVPNYVIMRRVLAETRSLLGKDVFRPKRIIDVGVGVGSSSASALDYFGQGGDDGAGSAGKDGYTGVEWVHGVDPSQSMRDAAKVILGSAIEANRHTIPNRTTASNRTKTRLTFGESLTDNTEAVSGANPVTAIGAFDLALCTYTLLELPSTSSALAMAAITWEKLRPNGVAIFIEPGTPDGFSALRSVRKMLLDCCPPHDIEASEDEEAYNRMEGDEECHVIAPCSHNGQCPMQRHKTFFAKDGEDDLSDEDFLGNDDITNDNNDDDDDEEEEEEDDDDARWDPLGYLFGTKNQSSSSSTASSASDNSKAAKPSTAVTDVHNSSFCSFVHHIPSEGGGGNDHVEKISYLVVQKRVTGPRSPTESLRRSRKDSNSDDDGSESIDDSTNPFHDTDIVELLSKSLDAGRVVKTKFKKDRRINKETHSNLLKQAIEVEDKFLDSDLDPLGLELIRGDNHRKSWGRIIRAPIKKKGHIILDYCSASGANTKNDGKDNDDNNNKNDGRIVRHRISRGESARSAPGMYRAARKARWGGLWPDVE